jgi:hypothetical protein
VLLEIGFKNKTLQYTLQKYVGLITSNCGIMLDNNKYLAYVRTGYVTHSLYIAKHIIMAK